MGNWKLFSLMSQLFENDEEVSILRNNLYQIVMRRFRLVIFVSFAYFTPGTVLINRIQEDKSNINTYLLLGTNTNEKYG